ncbi:polysaccharide biosynthesis C-terminal domain-containing protein [Stutzerimonas stutzeri]|jgi:O-antigen/teichoic acid export membrane protein|uniref:O-antigen/teichoic acid export membrane protein n=1 Tax=Stutzerimonas stutzeri TaxID=316 RepID=A0A5S5B677_STUST|nr:polysaccharide biosynthesis C-terminal domain-containing protein [Stutzerimonas stutzeri]TYP62008.1 O-antigen/teichoic acid export membrane protein [Stutzerimonas stutzeri]
MKSAYATEAPQPGMKADLVKYARLIVTKGSGAGATLGLNILLARFLVPELAGTVFFCVALGIFLSLLARLGLDIACLKNISSLHEGQQRSYFDRALMLAALMNIPAFLIGLAVVYFSETTQAYFAHAVVLFAVTALGLSLLSIASETLKAKHKTSEGLFWQTAFQPALTLLLVAITGNDLTTVVGCFAFSFTLAILGSILRARASLPRSGSEAALGWRPMLILCIPLMLIAVMNSIIELSDTLLLGVLRSASEVSIYYIAAKIAALSTTLLFIINGTIAPDISKRWARDDRVGAFAIVRKYSRFMLALALMILLAIGLLREYILAVFGPEYREQGVYPLLVLAVGYFFVLAAGPLGIFMTMTGNHRRYLHNNIAACVINVALNLILIPRYGVNGACFATAVALAIKNTLLYVQFKNIERSPTP